MVDGVVTSLVVSFEEEKNLFGVVVFGLQRSIPCSCSHIA
jgi:hypothetical protein